MHDVGNHNHPAIKELDLLVKDKIQEIKVKAKTTNNQSMKSLWEDSVVNMMRELNIKTKDQKLKFASALPQFAKIKTRFYKSKWSNFPKLPKKLEDLELLEEFKQTINKERFLINKDYTKGMIYASDEGLEILSHCKKIFADGTFYSTPEYFGLTYPLSKIGMKFE